MDYLKLYLLKFMSSHPVCGSLLCKFVDRRTQERSAERLSEFMDLYGVPHHTHLLDTTLHHSPSIPNRQHSSQ